MHNYCLREAFKCEVMLSQRASFRRFVPLERFNSQPCIFLSFSLAPLFFFLKRKKYTDQVCTLHKSHRKPFSSSMFANYLNFNFICIPQWQLIEGIFTFTFFPCHSFPLAFLVYELLRELENGKLNVLLVNINSFIKHSVCRQILMHLIMAE